MVYRLQSSSARENQISDVMYYAGAGLRSCFKQRALQWKDCFPSCSITSLSEASCGGFLQNEYIWLAEIKKQTSLQSAEILVLVVFLH